jgi:glycosyltransferase involved in cell wall biosynthesis
MRILQTPPRVFPYIGGVETVVLSLSRALARRGHDVTVVCADEPGGGPSDCDGVKIKRLRYPFKVANTNLTPSLPFSLCREGFDVVHTHLPTPWSADWSALIGRLRRKGVVVTQYNDIVGSGASGAVARLYNRACLPVTLRLADRVVVNSADAVDRAGPIEALPAHKLRVIPNAVDTGQFHPEPGLRIARTVGFLAVLDEFHRYKGLDILLRAVRLVLDAGGDIRLVVGGTGVLTTEYESLASSLGLDGVVVFLGRVADVTSFYNTCEVFVLPTTDRRQEGFGLVALEAMACGVPVIVSAAAGISQLVLDREAGVVVPAGDVSSLAQAIKSLLADGSAARELGGRARCAVEADLSWSAVAAQYERLYEECCHA